MHSDDKKRLLWDLAIVHDLKFGNDRLVRSATIKTRYGLTTRPINKLYPLEINCGSVNEDDIDSTKDVKKKDNSDKSEVITRRSVRAAAIKARENVKNWAAKLNKSE